MFQKQSFGISQTTSKQKIYDQVSNVIDMLYSDTIDENLKVTLASEDKDLVKLLTALKNENEKKLWEIFRSEESF